jgi:hypothetical protein
LTAAASCQANRGQSGGGLRSSTSAVFRLTPPLEVPQRDRLRIPSLPSVGAVSDGIAPPPATGPTGGWDCQGQAAGTVSGLQEPAIAGMPNGQFY